MRFDQSRWFFERGNSCYHNVFLSVTLILATIWIASCTVEAIDSSEPNLEGMWVSHGYGHFFTIEPSSITLHELTAISCVRSSLEISVESLKPNGTLQLRIGDDPAAAFLVPQSNSVAILRQSATASDIQFRRVTTSPRPCTGHLEDTPPNNFNVYWTTYSEHYPLFRLKGVNWTSIREKIGDQVFATTSPEKLFDLLVNMTKPFQDMHTGITAKSLGRSFKGIRSDPNLPGVTSVSEASRFLEKAFGRAKTIIETNYIEGTIQSFCNGHLRFGRLPGDVFYLSLDRERNFSDTPGFAAQLETLEAALDTIFAEVQDAKGLILDVRINFGGSDILSLALASRLSEQDYFAYTKVARTDPLDPEIRTPQQVRYVLANSRPGFYGPVVQLISRYTISAGETLTQALMGRTPQILRVGENTQGVFSDTLRRTLPNGWQFELPNELFLTQSGQYFDGAGIPPNIPAPVFQADDLDAGKDSALEIALGLLSANSE